MMTTASRGSAAGARKRCHRAARICKTCASRARPSPRRACRRGLGAQHAHDPALDVRGQMDVAQGGGGVRCQRVAAGPLERGEAEHRFADPSSQARHPPSPGMLCRPGGARIASLPSIDATGITLNGRSYAGQLIEGPASMPPGDEIRADGLIQL